jgi:glutaredoxin
MKRGLISLIIVLGAIFGILNFASAQEKIEINFFYSAICPHCAEEEEFLDSLEEEYPEIAVNRYEVLYHPESQDTLKSFYEEYQVPERERGYVPVTFLPEKYFVGFNQLTADEIKNCLEECLANGGTALQVNFPFLGQIDVSKMSLPALTVVLGALDGLNPCAMWVLLFLLTLLINTRSRRRMWLIGGTFIAASGLIYYLILTAWLNLFLAISYVNLTRIAIGVFAMGVGIWQIKNFITFHPGVCKVLGLQSKIKQEFQRRAEKIVSSPLTLAMIGGLIVLALGVNLVEFFCSAGFPAIFTRVLALNQVSTLSYYLYLLLYTFIFMLDDLIIFSLAVVTFSKIGFSEKYNYWATLIGGLLILILGILLIFRPEFLMFA